MKPCVSTCARSAGVIAIALVCAVAHAQQLFVADKLVLNVYAEPDQGSDKIATLETGDSVEALERAESFMRVRLQDGREGWVGANYLTGEAPALVRLKELQREQKSAAQTQSAGEIARLQKQNATLQSEIDQLKRKAAVVAPAAAAEEVSRESAPEPDNAQGQTVSLDNTAYEAGTAWIWAAFALVMGVAGYTLGYQTLARHVRKKFGGVKIY